MKAIVVSMLLVSQVAFADCDFGRAGKSDLSYAITTVKQDKKADRVFVTPSGPGTRLAELVGNELKRVNIVQSKGKRVYKHGETIGYIFEENRVPKVLDADKKYLGFVDLEDNTIDSREEVCFAEEGYICSPSDDPMHVGAIGSGCSREEKAAAALYLIDRVNLMLESKSH